MADTTTERKDQQQEFGDASRSPYPSDSQSPGQITSTFEQMTGGGLQGQSFDVISQIVTSYFDTVEANHRQARRIADLWAQQMLLSQSTSQIARQVATLVKEQVKADVRRELLAELRQSPRSNS